MRNLIRQNVLFLTLLFAFLIIGGSLLFLFYYLPSVEVEENNFSRAGELTTSTTKEKPLVFSERMFDPKRVRNIVPLGELNGGYIETQTINGVMVQMDGKWGEMPEEMKIYAPADMTLTGYSYHIWENSPPNWALEFKFNDDVSMELGHVTRVVTRIKDATTDTPLKDDSSTKKPKENITFEAGELIAYTTGTEKGHNWNIYLNDQKHENQFVNMDRFYEYMHGEEYLTSKCPFDYYQKEIKEEYISLMGATKAGQSKDCGSVSKDIAGSISGLWFLTKEGFEANYESEYATPFSIYRDSADQIIIYEINHERYILNSSNKSYKDPVEVKSEHCYLLTDNWDNSVKGYAYFKLISDIEMKASYGTSKTCPKTFPEENSKTYYR